MREPLPPEFYQDLALAVIAILGIIATLLWNWHHRFWKYVVVALGAIRGWFQRRWKRRG